MENFVKLGAVHLSSLQHLVLHRALIHTLNTPNLLINRAKLNKVCAVEYYMNKVYVCTSSLEAEVRSVTPSCPYLLQFPA